MPVTKAQQLKIAAHWLKEAAVALTGKDEYIASNLKRVAKDCEQDARKEGE